MASQDIVIPVRKSSKAALEQTRLQLRTSRSDLKRKLSTTFFEMSPLEYRKLRIEDLGLEMEQHRLHKSWLDIEHREKNLTDNDYRKDQRSANQRISSLGDELWKHKQSLRQEQEKRGEMPTLGPDSKGAFVNTLLALYKDPLVSAKCSSEEQPAMRNPALVVYESAKGAPKGKLWCPISQDYFDEQWMKTAHIVPHRITPSVVDYIFGLGSGSRLNTADNCLMIHSTVEHQFDNGTFVLLPFDPNESPIKSWKVQMTNIGAKNVDMGRMKLAALDGKCLSFKNDNRPAAGFLYYHFVVTLLRNKRDRQPGWEKYWVELPTGKPFATPGRYFRQSMLLTLAKSAGDLYPEEEARLLGEVGNETFEEAERLDEEA
ncbi:hypothetical protein MMC29_004929, partial [Sticta canariensis]|nr:hypothetical protein [Sticta canariensis]